MSISPQKLTRMMQPRKVRVTISPSQAKPSGKIWYRWTIEVFTENVQGMLILMDVFESHMPKPPLDRPPLLFKSKNAAEKDADEAAMILELYYEGRGLL